MKSAVAKRSIVIAGHKTSVSLEDEFWKGLREIADGRDTTLTELVSTIDADRKQSNLSSAIRLFVLGFYRDQIGSLRDQSSIAGARRRLSWGPTPPRLFAWEWGRRLRADCRASKEGRRLHPFLCF